MTMWEFIDKHPVATVVALVVFLLLLSDTIEAVWGKKR